MNTFDQDEQNIHDAISQINVDSVNLAVQVKNRLNDKTPYTTPHRVRWSLAVAIVISVMLVITVVGATLGSFDWLIEKINPSFGKIVEPVQIYCEDQGIRMEVIGAQKYDNMAIVYLSLQDISGKNRLTDQTDFHDGFSVKMNMHTQESSGQAETSTSGSVGYRDKILYFDKESNTIYYEFNITADSYSPLSDPLTLGSFLIYFDMKEYLYEPISLAMSDIGDAKFIPIRENDVWGGSNNPDDFGGLTAVLTPSDYAAMPHGQEDQLVSNIGVLDGKLHVQIGGIWNKEFGSGDATLFLKSLDGELIEYDYRLRLLSDGDYNFLNRDKNSYEDAVYKYDEFVFTVNTNDLSRYTLCYTGLVSSGVKGQWKVAANLSDTSHQIRILTNDIYVDDHLFEYMTLSPLGLQVIGTYKGDKCMASDMSLAIETVNGIIPLKGGGGSENSQKQTFNLSWNTEKPLDVTTVSAVIINDIRIPVK